MAERIIWGIPPEVKRLQYLDQNLSYIEAMQQLAVLRALKGLQTNAAPRRVNDRVNMIPVTLTRGDTRPNRGPQISR